MSIKNIAWLIALGALAIILTALASQHFGGLKPCVLCLQQRLPYYGGVPLALIAAWVAHRQPTIARGLFLPLMVIFTLSAGLGGYHAGVEYGWWAGPQSCGIGGDGAPENTQQLLQLLKTSPLVRCEETTFTLFGISMAGYNFIASLGLAGLALFGLSRTNNSDNGDA